MSTIDAEGMAAYVEIGAKRTFAGAVEWPGWNRAGRDEASALQGLADYGPRYAAVLPGTGLGFSAPVGPEAFEVAERVAGNATTDFGAPGVPPASDQRPATAADLARLRRILEASWAALDRAVDAAGGVELRKGPRGGGRELEAILEHVRDAEAAYLSGLALRAPRADPGDARASLLQVRTAVLEAMDAAARGLLPQERPRGGKPWPIRYFVRRTAWHALDHAWEIEDRSAP
ncbi:MAG: DinB family protein [Candidatus Limnocylindrales bacterium]